MEYDLIVKNGLIVSCIIQNYYTQTLTRVIKVTPTEVLSAGLEIGVKDGKIACVGTLLQPGKNTRIIDAQGAYITPGGVDSHVHLEQPDGSPEGDTWESGTRAAIAGGTTTVLAFAMQRKKDPSLFPVVADYHNKANGCSHCDYGFHVILTNPTDQIINEELPVLVQQGITSVKLYMTYEPFQLGDRAILDIMMAARRLGITTMVHAENSDMIALITERLEQRGLTDPYYHAVSRPQIAEAEATYRAISLAELIDVPILIVHVSSETAMAHIRNAQTRMLPIHGETCPHYAYLLSDTMKGKEQDVFEGAKHVCSPPLRHDPNDLTAIWDGIANGTLSVLSSDHAPTKFDTPMGKKAGLVGGKFPMFSKIPNGLPGIETRSPLMFNGAVGYDPYISLPQFVQITSTNPAMLYGLAGVKGNIAPGYDADLVIWYPPKQHDRGVQISIANMHNDTDYTPFEGMWIADWPRYTILRGDIVWNRDGEGILGRKGQGRFVQRKPGSVLKGRCSHRSGPSMRVGERELWRD